MATHSSAKSVFWIHIVFCQTIPLQFGLEIIFRRPVCLRLDIPSTWDILVHPVQIKPPTQTCKVLGSPISLWLTLGEFSITSPPTANVSPSRTSRWSPGHNCLNQDSFLLPQKDLELYSHLLFWITLTWTTWSAKHQPCVSCQN